MKQKPNQPKITFLRLSVLFIFAFIITSLFRTPVSWSDTNSHWFPQFVMAPISLVLCVLVHWIYIRPGTFPKIQAVFLWFLFGGAFTFCIFSLISSQRLFSLVGLPGPLDYLCHPSMFFEHPWGNF